MFFVFDELDPGPDLDSLDVWELFACILLIVRFIIYIYISKLRNQEGARARKLQKLSIRSIIATTTVARTVVNYTHVSCRP